MNKNSHFNKQHLIEKITVLQLKVVKMLLNLIKLNLFIIIVNTYSTEIEKNLSK